MRRLGVDALLKIVELGLVSRRCRYRSSRKVWDADTRA